MNRLGVRLVTLACFFGNRDVSNPRRVLEIPIPNQVPTNVNTAILRARPAWVLPHSAPVARDFYIYMVISASQNAPVERMERTTSKIWIETLHVSAVAYIFVMSIDYFKYTSCFSWENQTKSFGKSRGAGCTKPGSPRNLNDWLIIIAGVYRAVVIVPTVLEEVKINVSSVPKVSICSRTSAWKSVLRECFLKMRQQDASTVLWLVKVVVEKQQIVSNAKVSTALQPKHSINVIFTQGVFTWGRPNFRPTRICSF